MEGMLTDIHLLRDVDISALKEYLSSVDPQSLYQALRRRDGDQQQCKTALHCAALYSKEIMEACLNAISPEQRYDLLQELDALGRTVDHYAATLNRYDILECIRGLIKPEEWNSLLNIKTHGGRTAVHCATKRGHIMCIQYILDNLTFEEKVKLLDIRDTDNDQTALEIAVEYKQFETAELLQDARTSASYYVRRTESGTAAHAGAAAAVSDHVGFVSGRGGLSTGEEGLSTGEEGPQANPNSLGGDKGTMNAETQYIAHLLEDIRDNQLKLHSQQIDAVGKIADEFGKKLEEHKESTYNLVNAGVDQVTSTGTANPVVDD